MTDQAFAQADPEWVELISLAREWFQGPVGQLMLREEEKLLETELARFFGGYLVHYGPGAEAPPHAKQVHRNVRLGAPLPGVEIVCEEQAWPLAEHAADVVVLQHGLDFSLSPHGLLRQAASAVRPGGHLLIVGINPWSSWGMRHLFSKGALRKARCIPPSRVGDWLNLLGFALEKRRFGCYRPPLASPAWQQRLTGWERVAGGWQMSGGGVYLLIARKMVVGLRPLQPARREPMGKLLPLPLAKVNRDPANRDHHPGR
ncbi:methyltransferase domain-containing protein [Pseudomonas shirazensis]|jgi:SAM-dependent methyltransferase|uniref:Methyltransferase type 11 domain-containing protein n=2 Tax=Pseudomonas TaxID=286 RepID=A0A5E6QUR3_PSEFL|nr:MULTISPECIES: methyltransferase domain-containing protein [Pseudomonas]AUF95787.1 SAM-dependent methyltransferase [Pseudomonas sp. 02C 26]MBA1323720.1 class I SAM-dependent methyltransferase [Pseudomonas plecoglossicida]MCS4285502.1 SAM-dependent methyltransferase [Pseudomonas sp. BIGb0278]QYX53425.1 class I SAM-dependent methyltransferase [Pseudomonas sp. S07E 245]RZI89260.1 MAG: SAM-dependent methyltransferase [Pseudomonas sp.]